MNFLNTVSVSISRPTRANYGKDEAFALYISSTSINIPVNSVTLTTDSKYPLDLVSYKQHFYDSDNLTLFDFSKTASNSLPSNYFSALNGVFMPHIPFFSNCR